MEVGAYRQRAYTYIGVDVVCTRAVTRLLLLLLLLQMLLFTGLILLLLLRC